MLVYWLFAIYPSDRPTKCAKVHISTQISFWQCLLVIRYSHVGYWLFAKWPQIDQPSVPKFIFRPKYHFDNVCWLFVIRMLVIGYSPNGLRSTNQVCQSSYFDPNIILTMSVGYSLFGVGYWLFAKWPQIDQPSVPKFIFRPKYHFDNVCWLFVIRMLVIGYSPNGLRSTNQVCQSSYFDPNIILTMSVGYSLFGVGYWLFAKWPQIDQPSVPKFIFRPKYHFDNVCWLFVIRCWLLVIRQMASDRPTKCAKVHISTQISFWQCLLVIRYSVLVIGYSPNGLRSTNQVCQSSYFDPNIILTMSVGYSLFGVGYWLFAKWPQIDQPSVPKFIFRPKYHFDNVCWLFVIRCWLLVIRQMASDRPTKCAKVHISTQISFWQCLLVIRYSVLVIGYSPNGLRSTNQVCQSSYFDPNIILTMSVGYSLFGVGYWLFAKWPQIDQPSVPKFIFRPKYHFDNVCWLFVIRCWLLVIRQMASDRPTKCAKVHISTQISFWQCLLVIRYSHVGYWLFAKWPQIDQPSVPKFIFRPKYHFDNVCWLFVIRCWLLVIRQMASDRPTKCAKVHISTQISFWQCLLVIRYSVLVIGYSPNGLRSTNQVCQSSYFDPNIILTMSVGYSLFDVGYWLFAKWPQIDQPSVPKFIFRPKYHFDNVCWLFVIRCWLLVIRQMASDRPTKCAKVHISTQISFWQCLLVIRYSMLVIGYSPNGLRSTNQVCQSSYFDPNIILTMSVGYSLFDVGYWLFAKWPQIDQPSSQSSYFDPNINFHMSFSLLVHISTQNVPKFIFRPK